MITRNIIAPVLILAMALTVSRAQGQTAGANGADTVLVASLDAMIATALDRNPGLQAAEKRYRSLAVVAPQVSSLPDPMLGYTRWVESVETRVGPQENVFVLSQQLPFPGKLGLKRRMAESDARAAFEEFQAARRDLIYNVKTAYGDLYRIDRSLEILGTYLRLLEDFAQVAATKYATGNGIQAQVLKAHVEISSISVQELNFRKMRKSVVARLNALMDRPAETPVGVAADLDLPEVDLQATHLLQMAKQRRQELRSVEAMIDRAESMRQLARKNYLPDFNLQAMYITIPRVNSMFADAGKDAFSVMVGLNLPIWLGKRRAAVDEASEMRASQSLRYENVWNTVEAEITDLVFQIQTIRQTLDLYEGGLLLQAESSLESALSAYKTGRLDFLNLLDAERMLLNLRLGYAQEQANYFKQLAALERAVGGDLF